MAVSSGATGKGTLLKINTSTSPATFNAVVEVRSLTGPSQDTEFADATHMESPNNVREVKPSFKSPGEIQLELNFLPDDTTTQKLIQDSYDSQAKRGFKLTFATFSKIWSFDGYVKSFQPSANPGEMLTASCTIQIDGVITRT